MIAIETYNNTYFVSSDKEQAINEAILDDTIINIECVDGQRATLKPTSISEIRQATKKEQLTNQQEMTVNLIEPPEDKDFKVERTIDHGQGRLARLGVDKDGRRVARVNYKWEDNY